MTQIFICPTNSFYNFECKAFWLPREQLILYIFLISRTWLVVWMYAYYVSNLLPSCCEEPTVIAWTDEACLSLPWIVYKADRLFLFLNRHFVAMLSSINELKICISNWYNFGISRISVLIFSNVFVRYPLIVCNSYLSIYER